MWMYTVTGCIGVCFEYLEYESHVHQRHLHQPQTDRQHNDVAEASEVISVGSRLHPTVNRRIHHSSTEAADHAVRILTSTDDEP